MAHFARLGLNNEVISVHVVDNENLLDTDGNEQEQIGIDYLLGIHGGGTWVQTSYNTRGGIHYALNSNDPDEGITLRKNYAGIGYTYDESRDAFIAPKPYPSWVLDEPTCTWEAPVPQPEGNYIWNEQTQIWDLVEE